MNLQHLQKKAKELTLFVNLPHSQQLIFTYLVGKAYELRKMYYDITMIDIVSDLHLNIIQVDGGLMILHKVGLIKCKFCSNTQKYLIEVNS